MIVGPSARSIRSPAARSSSPREPSRGFLFRSLAKFLAKFLAKSLAKSLGATCDGGDACIRAAELCCVGLSASTPARHGRPW